MIRKSIAAVGLALLFASCDSSLLDEEVYSELGPTNFFRSEQDAMAVLNSAYATEQEWAGRDYFLLGEVPADIMIDRQGGLERLARPLEDFNWDPTHEFFQRAWNESYTVVYRSNVILDRIGEIPMSEAARSLITAEARFLRAEAYMQLWELFGPTPLITSSDVEPAAKPARATEAEIVKFVEDEFRAAANALPRVAPQYGRATKGAALGFLTRFQMNNKKWQAAAATAKELMDLGQYALYSGPRADLFKVENERNSEFIHVMPFVTNVRGSAYLAHAAPPNYQFKAPPKTNFATQYMLLASFTSSFHPDDRRQDAIVKEYRHTNGSLVRLAPGNYRSFKYQEDLAAVGNGHGNDASRLRYADILLMRAEALNEISGPNAESIALINQVRAKAEVPLLTLSQFPTKEALRDHILQERAWEFHTEGLRRLDLIRHDKFISSARARGKVAGDFRVRYPLPQAEIDKNSELKQNPGY